MRDKGFYLWAPGLIVSYTCQQSETTFEVSDPRSLLTLLMQEREGPERDSNPDLPVEL